MFYLYIFMYKINGLHNLDFKKKELKMGLKLIGFVVFFNLKWVLTVKFVLFKLKA